MKIIALTFAATFLFLQAEGPRKFAPTLPELLKPAFDKINAGLSQAAVLPDSALPAAINEEKTRLPAATRALAKPLEMPTMALEAIGDTAQAEGSVAKMLEASSWWWSEKRPDPTAKKPIPVPASASTEEEDDEKLVQVFADLEIDAGNIPDDLFREEVRKKIASIPQPMRRLLAETLEAMRACTKAFAEPLHGMEPESREFFLAKGAIFQHPEKEETEQDQRRVARLVHEKFASPALLQSMFALTKAVDRLIPVCTVAPNAKIPLVVFERETPIGLVLIGGPGKNQYEKDAALLIDLGGDDLYRNNAGGGMHVPGRVAVAIDCAGNDRYDSKKDGVQGAGVLGCGILVDLAGDDTYLAGNQSQGCGQLGFGLLIDRAGLDKYNAGGIVQGAGQFGIGILEDAAGDDDFKATVMAQGFGGPEGMGLLLDRKGKDKYFAGGKYPDTARDQTKFLSMSQGFGYGLRFVGQNESGASAITGWISGGVGLLLDGAGDDQYDAQVFGQGCGYWFSLGILADESGNDVYKSVRYGQGAAAHFGAGFLGDFWGNDSYSSAIASQACGHDFSVAMLLDYLGNDSYKAETLSQGAANARGSFAWLIDRDGTDNYTVLGKEKSCWGAVATGEFKSGDKPASFAFFHDLAGKDIYKGPRSMKDGAEVVDENFQLGFASDK